MASTLRTPPTDQAPSSTACETDQVQVARGEVRNRFDAARLQRAGHHHGVHAHARQRAAVDVDGVDAASGHDLVHLLEHAIQRDALGRIDFDRNEQTVPPATSARERFPARAIAGRASAGASWRTRTLACAVLLSFGRPQLLHRLGHRTNVFRSGAAASADDARAQRHRVARKQRKSTPAKSADRRCDRRRAWGNPALGMAESGLPVPPSPSRMRQQRLRAQRAIRADGLHVFGSQPRCRFPCACSVDASCLPRKRSAARRSGSAEKERIASMAASKSSRLENVSRIKKSTPRSSSASACSR